MNDAGTQARDGAPARAFASIDDLDCRGRRVFVRVDPYVLDDLPDPPAEPAAPTDAVAARDGSDETPEAPAQVAPPCSLRRLLELDARVVVGTHLADDAARATGLRDMEQVAERLSSRLGVDVLMPDECVGDAVTRVTQNLRKGQICLLPDLGLARGEVQNEESFARGLAQQVEAYVGDAFGVSHLEYASLVKLPRLFRERALGYAAQRELEGLGKLLGVGRGTLTGWVGGASFAEKVPLLEEWLPRFHTLSIGGNVALTLLAAQGRAEVSAAVEADRLAQARSFVARARHLGVQLLLPSDFRVVEPPERRPQIVAPRSIRSDAKLVDIGPETCSAFAQTLSSARELLWWAPLGDVNDAAGLASSQALADACAASGVHATWLGSDLRRWSRRLPAPVRNRIGLIVSGSKAAQLLMSKRKLPGVEALRVRH